MKSNLLSCIIKCSLFILLLNCFNNLAAQESFFQMLPDKVIESTDIRFHDIPFRVIPTKSGFENLSTVRIDPIHKNTVVNAVFMLGMVTEKAGASAWWGPPEKDENGERGLHDRIGNIPASLMSITQPDLRSDCPVMSITGKIVQSVAVVGPHLELKRTISAKLGSSGFKITDEVTNLGNTPAPHMLLYHFNFGWPLVDEGTDIIWKGKWQSRGGKDNDFIFNESNFPNLKKCLLSKVDSSMPPNCAAFEILSFHNLLSIVGFLPMFSEEMFIE